MKSCCSQSQHVGVHDGGSHLAVRIRKGETSRLVLKLRNCLKYPYPMLRHDGSNCYGDETGLGKDMRLLVKVHLHHQTPVA